MAPLNIGAEHSSQKKMSIATSEYISQRPLRATVRTMM
jgi:hypothetical protein